LRPAFHPSGLDRATALANGIQAVSLAETSPLVTQQPSEGQPVKMQTGGFIVVAAVVIIPRSLQWRRWTNSTGRRRISNYWPANESSKLVQL